MFKWIYLDGDHSLVKNLEVVLTYYPPDRPTSDHRIAKNMDALITVSSDVEIEEQRSRQ